MTSDREGPAEAEQPDAGADATATATANLDILRLALRGLPAREREALTLAVVHRMDVHAIAGRLGVDAGVARSALRDGLTSLRAVLDVATAGDGAPAAART